MVSLVETEWEGCVKQLRLLEGWSIRGVFHIFLATFTLHIATATGISEFDRSVNLYSLVAGYSMLACGCLYVLGGLLCFGKIKRGKSFQIIKVEPSFITHHPHYYWGVCTHNSAFCIVNLLCLQDMHFAFYLLLSFQDWFW